MKLKTERKAGNNLQVTNQNTHTHTADRKLPTKTRTCNKSKLQKQCTFKRAMKPHYFVKWMQSLINSLPEPVIFNKTSYIKKWVQMTTQNYCICSLNIKHHNPVSTMPLFTN